MNKKILYALLITPFLIFAFYNTSYSKKTYAPANQTGANGEPSCGFSGTATNTCHGSPTMCGSIPSVLGTLNQDVVISANGTIIDSNFEYIPDTEYTIVFTVLNPTASGGFSFSAMDASNNYVGTLSVDAGAEAEISVNNSNYVGHTNSLGMNEWTFKWTAPSANTGNVTFFASSLKGNGVIGPAPINSCGDTIIPIKFEISEKDIENPDFINSVSILKECSLKNNPILNNTIIINTIVKEPKRFFIAIYDLTGKLIIQKEQVFHTGIKTLEIPLNNKGMFIINITTDKNEFANYKILN